MASPQEIMSAFQGSFIVNDAIEKTIIIDAIVVLEDTVFSSIKIAGVDEKANYIADTTLAVKGGAIIRPTGDKAFSGVQLVSGSVALIL
jgi:hypothetical protein